MKAIVATKEKTEGFTHVESFTYDASGKCIAGLQRVVSLEFQSCALSIDVAQNKKGWAHAINFKYDKFRCAGDTIKLSQRGWPTRQLAIIDALKHARATFEQWKAGKAG